MLAALRRFDWMLFGTILVLLTLSVLFIYSADYRNGEVTRGMAKLQLRWVIIGLGCYAGAAIFDYRKLKDLHWWIYAASLGSLILVFFFPENQMLRQNILQMICILLDLLP